MMIDDPQCKCKTEPVEDVCPYQDEFCSSDKERDELELCQCCDYCRGQCAMDI